MYSLTIFACVFYPLHHRDFISQHTLRVEAGLSHMMEQLVTNMKARRLMGEVGESDKGDVRKAERT